MNSKIDSIVDSIMDLKLLEAADLVKILQEKLGVSGMPAMGMMPQPQDASSESKVEEKTSFKVVLKSFPPENKINIIKEIRTLSNLSLMEAKAKSEQGVVVLKEGVSKEEALKIQDQFKKVGDGVVVDLE